MMRNPRNQKTDNLVTRKLIGFAYFQIGVIQALAGFFSYFVVMAFYGFPPNSLPDMTTVGKHFLPSNSLPVMNVNGQILSHDDQQDILTRAQTTYFITIIVVQWADLLICKTRKLSLVQQGLKNMMLNFGLFFETAVALILVYTPWVGRNIFRTRPVRFEFWCIPLPFFVVIFVYDEVRKLMIRTTKGGWVERMTYW